MVGKAGKHIDYADPCGGCICNHCANSVECLDMCTGEMELTCFTCDECKWYDGKGNDNQRANCRNYKITEVYAKAKRKRFKVR